MTEALPNAQEIEQEILGGIILGEISLDNESIGLTDQDFYSPKNRQIFQALASLEETSYPLIISRLREWNCLEKVGGPAYLTKLQESFIHGGFVRKNVEILHEKRKLRQAIEICQRFDDGTRNGGADLSQAVHGLSALLESGPANSGSWDSLTLAPIVSSLSIAHLVDQEIEYALRPLLPISSLVLLQGLPKKGKSAFALQMAISVAKGSWPSGRFIIEKPSNVLFLEFEDAPILVAKRMAKFIRGIDIGHSGKEFPENFFFCSFPDLPLDSEKYADLLIQEVERLKIGLIVIDTLSFVHRAESENSSADMKSVMASLKRIAVRTNSCVLAIHHAAKGSEDRDGVEKGRGSSAISAAADVILDWGNRKKTNKTPVQVFSKIDDGDQDFIVEYKKMGDTAVEWEILGAEEEHDQKKEMEESNRSDVLAKITELTVKNPSGEPLTNIIKELPEISDQITYKWIRKLEKEGIVSVSIGLGRGTPKTVRLICK